MTRKVKPPQRSQCEDCHAPAPVNPTDLGWFAVPKGRMGWKIGLVCPSCGARRLGKTVRK